MSDQPTFNLPAEAVPFLNVWAESLSQVLGQVSGLTLTIEVADAPGAELPVKVETDLNICVILEGTLRGEMNLRLPRQHALHWAQTFMAETPDASKEFSPEYKEAVEELLRQVAGQVVTGLKSQWGQNQIHLQITEPPTWSIAANSFLRVGEESHWFAEAQLSAALVTSLRPQTPAAGVALEPAFDDSTRNLDLLLDVELSLKLRFGERRMLLKEILDLNSGAVIELDREIQEPVDVLLDDKLIARGEVVVVDGNYGIRLTEVAPLQ